jgi:RNA polymerase sigma factor (sigma-70 family)
MHESERLTERFEDHRDHLRAVAYRMLGSLAEAEDAVQDTWLRLTRADRSEVENLRAWLTTVTARVCLNMLRARNIRRSEPLDSHVPDPIVRLDPEPGPEDVALLADSVGLALLVVLDTLTPAERLAFVLHDMFALPFDEIGPMIGRSSAATRQLASRARRRVKGADIRRPDADLSRQRDLVDAFFAAARGGGFDDLVAILDPEVVLRVDGGDTYAAASIVLQGSGNVATQAGKGIKSWLSRPGTELHPAVVNGSAGVIVVTNGAPRTVIAFTTAAGKIVEIDAISEPARVARLAASAGLNRR